jgi:hypothetical protein
MKTRYAPFLIACIVITAACAASPRQRPVSAGDVDTGANSLTAARKQLEGRWTLISLDISAEDGRKPGR